MVGSSILPVAFHKNKLYFLFGKEVTHDAAPGWSDFGGGIEKDETPLETALREGGEELTGFLGDAKQLQTHIKRNKNKIYHFQNNLPNNNQYHVHVIYYPYDENLPKYYNQNHEFLWKRMDREILSKTKLFEKSHIKWFSINELKKRKHEFREFYQDIVENLLLEIPKIKQFFSIKKITKRSFNKNKKTRKQR